MHGGSTDRSLSLLPRFDVDRAADAPDRALGNIGGSDPGRPGRERTVAEAGIANIAVVGRGPGVQHDGPLGGDDLPGLIAGHVQGRGGRLRQGARRQACDGEEDKSGFHAVAF